MLALMMIYETYLAKARIDILCDNGSHALGMVLCAQVEDQGVEGVRLGFLDDNNQVLLNVADERYLEHALDDERRGEHATESTAPCVEET